MAKPITHDESEEIIAALRAYPRIRFERIGARFGRSYGTIAAIAKAHDMVQRGRS
jgi:hypothetical protein